MINNKIIQSLLIEELDNSIVSNYFASSNDAIYYSYISDVIDVEENMRENVKKLYTPKELFDKYQQRSGLQSRYIEAATEICDFGSFKKSYTFDKKKLCDVIVVLQLTYEEAMELLLACDILLNEEKSVYDCAFKFYLKNYNKVASPRDNVIEFKSVVVFAEEYVKQRIKELR